MPLTVTVGDDYIRQQLDDIRRAREHTIVVLEAQGPQYERLRRQWRNVLLLITLI